MINKVLISATLILAGVVSGLRIHKPPVLPNTLDPSKCPPSFRQHPLILVSMDGFRAEYMTRGFTPTIVSLANKGVRAPYMKASYPTITFPNHYTIATGMYPSAHGIVANKFFDPAFNAEFRVGRNESLKLRWWGGEPIWMTAENQGKRAATYFWPGSDVQGNRATFWFPYNISVPFENRVDQVLAWLDLPPARRPSFLTLYMHEPDTVGHKYGPDTPQVDQSLVRVDSMVKRLIEGLQRRNLLSCVDILVVADHGMAEAGVKRHIRLDQYIPNVVNRTRFWPGVFGRMTPNDRSEATKQEMLDALSCKKPELRVYDKTTLPVRWHMNNQPRVEEIVVDLDAGYTVAGDNTFEIDAGDHGYDNYFAVMNAMFVAHGPSFRRNTEVEAFQNIELYNLMCHLLRLKPSPNNGTWGALHHLLRNPPPYPAAATYELAPRIPGILSKESALSGRSNVANCEGDHIYNEESGNELFEVLEEAQEELSDVVQSHLPWGIPTADASFRDSLLLLPQPESVTGYSTLVKMPLWSSYTLDSKPRKGNGYIPWKSDLRLMAGQSPSCDIYRTVRSYSVKPYPLFPAYFTQRSDCAQLPFLMSNAVPVTDQLAKRWEQLLTYVKQWAKRFGNVNVVSGPVFDYDSDTFVDDLRKTSTSGGLLVPTHMYLVVTRCLFWVDDLANCPHTHLDASAFVYPQYLPVSNCLSPSHFAREFSATVQDVEKITGLRFFSTLRYEDRVRLTLRVHSNIWGNESWWNRLRSDAFGLL